ncbi:MAG: molecular chaperone TorD family protein [Sedimenticola sp.]
MSSESKTSEMLASLCGVISDDISMLATLHDREPDSAMLQLLKEEHFPEGLGLRLIGEPGSRALDLVTQSREALPDEIDGTILDELAADYADIYLNHSIQASPLESVWTDDESLACQDSMFQVRSWYSRYGLMAEDWRVRSDDHLVLQLQFLAHLFSLEKEDEHEHLGDVARFMDEHLLRWLTSFAERVMARCRTPYFAGIAMLTAAYCEEIRDLLASILDEPRPSPEEIEERMRPKQQQEEEVPVSFMPGMGPAV